MEEKVDHSNMFEPVFDRYIVDERTAQAFAVACEFELCNACVGALIEKTQPNSAKVRPDELLRGKLQGIKNMHAYLS